MTIRVPPPQTYGAALRPLSASLSTPTRRQADLDAAEDIARGRYLDALFRSGWAICQGTSFSINEVACHRMKGLAQDFMAAHWAAEMNRERSR